MKKHGTSSKRGQLLQLQQLEQKLSFVTYKINQLCPSPLKEELLSEVGLLHYEGRTRSEAYSEGYDAALMFAAAAHARLAKPS